MNLKSNTQMWMILLLICMLLLILVPTKTNSVAQENTPIRIDKFEEMNPANISKIELVHKISLSEVHQIAWSQNEKMIAFATDNGIWIYDLVKQALWQVGSDRRAYDVEFLDSADRLIGKYERNSSIYDYILLELIKDIPFPFSAINQSQNLAALGGIEFVDVYDLATSELIYQIPVTQYSVCEYACPVHDVAFNHAGTYLAFSSAVPEVESAIVNIETLEKITPVEMGVLGLNFSNNDEWIASRTGEVGFLSNGLFITSSNTGEKAFSINLHGVYATPTFNKSDSLLVAGGISNPVLEVNEATGLIIFIDILQATGVSTISQSNSVVHELGLNRTVTSTEFSPSGRLLVVGELDGNISMWGVLKE